MGYENQISASMAAEASPDVLAFATFPKEHWRQIWSRELYPIIVDSLALEKKPLDIGASTRWPV